MTFEFPKKLPKTWIEAIERDGRVHVAKNKNEGLDPDFGYKTKGGTSQSIGNVIAGSVFTITEDGTADSITVWLYNGTPNAANAKCAIYKHSDLSLVGSTEQLSIPGYFGNWKTFNFAAPKPSLTSNTAYVLVCWGISGGIYMYYDAGDTDQGHEQVKVYDSWPNPLVPYHYNKKYSIYCTYTAAGPTLKSFSDSGAGSDAFLNPYRAMKFSEVGHGVEAFNTPFRTMGFVDVGHGADIFFLLAEKGFSDSGLGSDSFTILFKAFKFSDVGYGADAFNIPFKAMNFLDVGYASDVFAILFKAMKFSDVGQGVDAFKTPFRAMGFSDVSSGLDSFTVLLFRAFADAGLGSDAFTKELIGFLEKVFADSGLGTDSFLIPFKTLRFSDAAYGSDVFALLRMLTFSDTGLASDVFAVVLKGMKFSDIALGTDAFSIPFKALKFSEACLGSDAFNILFKAMRFADSGLGSDVFSIYFKALIFSDLGSGADAFSKWILGEIVSKTFSDIGLGADIWRGANLIEAPLVIVTADGKIILRLSKATKKEPDYISLE